VTTPLTAVPGRLAVPVNDLDHVLGPADAPVTMVEYGDYQCPFCGRAYPNVQAVLRRRADQLRFVYRHFPLSNVHPAAEPAAEAAEAAGAQGQYWPAHDWLFQHQDQLDPADVVTGLDEPGLDGALVARDMRLHTYLPKVRADFIGGVQSGVAGTPTFFINGIMHPGGYTALELLAAVDSAM